LLFSLLLLALAKQAYGQTPSEPELMRLRSNLLQADLLLTQLESNLQTRGDQVANLETRLQTLAQTLADSKAEIVSLKSSLASSEDSRARLEAALSGMQTSLDDLTTRYEVLSKSWESYRAEMQKQVKALEAERLLWQIIAGVAVVAAVGTTIWALVK
jgi:chromosome segregation ATPase